MGKIISVTEVQFGGNTRRAKKRYGWNVWYHGRVLGEKRITTTRTTKKNGEPLKKPVVEVQTVYNVPMSGVISKVVRRRKSLRKLGVRI